MSNLKIRTKIFIGFAVVLAVLLSALAFSGYSFFYGFPGREKICPKR